jgi:hypothetical protein
MSKLQLTVSDEDWSYISQVAQERNWTREKAVEFLFRQAVKNQRDWEYLQERARRGREITQERYLELLNKAPDVPPIPGDELPEGWSDQPNKH